MNTNSFVEKIPMGTILVLLPFILIFTFVLSLKVGGASNLPIFVEKDGYCKIQYDSEWKYSETNFYCYNLFDRTQENTFTEEEFRQVCPKVNFLSTTFYSDCFHKGDVRNHK